MSMEQSLRDALSSLERHVPDAGQVADRVRSGAVTRRRRNRARLAIAGTAAVATAAAGTLVAASVASAPSAYAAVSQAAARTFSESYHVRAVTTGWHSMVVTGDTDPARNVGQVNVGEPAIGTGQFRYVDGHTYIYNPAGVLQASQWYEDPAPALGKAQHVHCGGRGEIVCGWGEEVPVKYPYASPFHPVAASSPVPALGKAQRIHCGGRVKVVCGRYEGAPVKNDASAPRPAGASSSANWLVRYAHLYNGLTGIANDSPAELLALLHSATTVRADGAVSGPGWTGTRYSFTMPLPLGMFSSLSGTVDIDQQGRVRHIRAFQKPRFGAPPSITNDITFSDFGERVSITAPPASQVTKVVADDFSGRIP